MTSAVKICPPVVVIGACHTDSIMTFDDAPVMGRTNPASVQRSRGGVAANIARHLAAGGHEVSFIGVAAKDDFDRMTAELHSDGIHANLAVLPGKTPSYTALIGPDGDLVLGVADMALYDQVSPHHLLASQPASPAAAATIVIDTNFPCDTLAELAAALSDECHLFAAGTSVHKIGRLAGILPRLDGLVMNRAEAEQITDTARINEMAASIAGMMRPLAHVLISDSTDTAVLATARGEIALGRPPPATAELVNANGAGDAMAATLFSHLIRQRLGLWQGSLQQVLDGALAAGAAWASNTARR